MNQQAPLKFALAGSGAVAAHHVKALRQTGTAEVVRVCGPNAEKTRAFAGSFQIPWTTRYTDILDDPAVEVVDIVVPSGLHAEYGLAAARAGKHVVVEKPIDVTLEKADALIRECRQAGVTLAVISQYRFLDAMQKIYEIKAQGKLGKLLHGEVSVKWYRSMDYYHSAAWRGTKQLDGGGPFINQAIHFIDLLLSVMGPVQRVTGKTATVAHDIEVEDIGMALLEFSSGATGVIQASTAIYPGLPARLEIHGADGTAILEGEKLALLHYRGAEPSRDTGPVTGGASAPMAIDVQPFEREFTDIIGAIREKREPLVNGGEARRALQLVLAIYESSRENSPVYL
ncbi:MAG TPA: Gfo/Idh/MocA family oxidoreductase [bacterium]|nr:Gfo/Idh/MocA family oxidoreductase [bacterium]HPN45083.1 Gfo/Idh/MocA family oxidoreductase [bacterium]